jgi:hypothetical protein
MIVEVTESEKMRGTESGSERERKLEVLWVEVREKKRE